ncbi:MAG: right-handed parallel beta-helix repeat-containing protein [Firmicutes bacterium]|nr:right-handed parallel beta-helix repeat-containing protein [Bacillota bacterium]MDY5531569.1 right-handed parallel beta-helix repeat-containing protein [Pumilibacteraceae bacterium]
MKKLLKSKTFLGAILSIALCMSLIAGATFAIFTSEASVNIAVGTATVQVTATVSDFHATSPEKITTAGVVVDNKYVAGFVNGGAATQNGNEITLENVTPGDKVTFKITVHNGSTVKVRYRTRVIVREDNGLFGALKMTIGNYTGMGISNWKELAVNSDDEVLNCKIELPAGSVNDYQNKKCKIAFIVEAIQGNAKVVNDTAYYTLKQFNALTEIPEGVKNVYVDLGGVQLKNLKNGVADPIYIGNTNIADHYHYGEWNSTTAPEGYPYDTGRTDKRTSDGAVRHIYSTGKQALNVIVTGYAFGAKDSGGFNEGAISLRVPDASTVTFSEVTFEAGQMSMSVWNETGVQSMTVAHRIEKIVFDGCTFKGNWLQNGNVGAKEMVINNCKFALHENEGGIAADGFNNKNNSNPIWIQNMGQCNVTIENCEFAAVRPIKLWEGGTSGTIVIKNNTFNMSPCSIDTENTNKNVAIMFSTLGSGFGYGNIEVSGNTVKGNATAFLSFYNTTCPAMAEGATFTVSGNTLNGAKLGVVWKSAEYWMPTCAIIK